jgi:hypothetical protein
MKPVQLTEQQKEDTLSTINRLKLALLADEHKQYDLVPTALECAIEMLQILIDATCVDE